MLLNINSNVQSLKTKAISSAIGTLGSNSGLLTSLSKTSGLNANALLLGSPTKIKYIKVDSSSTDDKSTVATKKLKGLSKMVDNATTKIKQTEDKINKAKNRIVQSIQDKLNATKSGVGGAISNLTGSLEDSNQYSEMPLDIVKTVTVTYTQEVTEHPVEEGFVVHDNVVNKPMKLTMVAGVSSSPITWYDKNGHGSQKFSNAFKALVEIRNQKEVVTIVRSNGEVYSNMVMTSCSYERNPDSLSVIWVNMEFIQIRKVKTELIDVPDGIVAENTGESGGGGGGGGANQGEAGNIEDVENNNTTQKTKNYSWAKGAVRSVYNGLSSNGTFDSFGEGAANGIAYVDSVGD